MSRRFLGGFFLSIPLALMYFWGFGSLSDADNEFSLIIMGIFFIATLPGSLILFVIGFGAAFSGKTGELIAASCFFLSVANAHLMGMLYFGWLFKKAHAPREQLLTHHSSGSPNGAP